jgi:hypothetical protein
MIFKPLAPSEVSSDVLKKEYKNKEDKEVANVKLSTNYLFFKTGFRTYFIAYNDIYRFFRRVVMVAAKIGCCNGEMPVNYVVICGDKDQELAQIQMPGEKAAKALVDELKVRLPHARFGKPSETLTGNEHS